MTLLTSFALAALIAQAAPPTVPPQPVPQTVPNPAVPPSPEVQKTLEGLGTQVALDRAGFSPGALDGDVGASTKKALDAYKKANGGNEPPRVDPVTKYEISDADVAGPFQPKIPSELPDQAKLEALGYKDVVEALAERFHTTPALLRELNPEARFAAREQIVVPNVEPLQIPAAGQTVTEPAPEQKAERGKKPQEKAVGTGGRETATPPPAAKAAKPDVVVTVSKERSALTVTDAAGKMLMYAPVTTGSSRDPLPIGEWKVNGITLNPPFRYNPDLFWDADPSHTKALLKPGPNNPVGLVWIDLSKEHYGIHGTPEPSTIGRTQSHGCVRLTNWDAVRLANLVKPGTKVVFKR